MVAVENSLLMINKQNNCMTEPNEPVTLCQGYTCEKENSIYIMNKGNETEMTAICHDHQRRSVLL